MAATAAGALRSRRCARSLLALGALSGLLLGGAAHAHVAPSLDDNNRYLKLTVLEDRVRLVYTVFFGQVPGAAERRAMDRDHDGALADDELGAFAGQLADQVAAALQLTIDGAVLPVTFAQRSVGGAFAGTQGAFSVDLVASWCVPAARTHRVSLRDRFAVPRPGETEVLLEDGPGVTVTSARLGSLRAKDRGFRLAGRVPALAEPGLLVEVAIEPGPPGRAACQPGSGPRSRGAGAMPSTWLALALVLALAAGALIWRAARRRAAG